MLLDTCVVQNVAWIFELTETCWTEEAVAVVRARLPHFLAVEILALGDLIFMYSERGDGPLWAVSGTSLAELARVRGPKGQRLMRWWSDLADYWEGVASDWEGCPHVRPDKECPPVSPDQLPAHVCGSGWSESIEKEALDVLCEDLVLRRLQDTVEPADHGEREDDSAVLALLVVAS
jgi:hypothetical protein